jgi:protein-S-isoprenylcysteine O-methyltransferase Ste14
MEFVFTPTWPAAVYWAATALWVAEFVLFPSRRYGTRDPDGAGYWTLVAVIAGTFAVSGLLYHLRGTRLTDAAADAARAVGITAYVVGILLRYWAAWALGPWFSRVLRAGGEQALIDRGPYRWLRHPLYVGLFLLAAGMNLMMTTVLGSVLGLVATAWALNRRMAQEERLLESVLGTRYRVWKEARYRLVPGWF